MFCYLTISGVFELILKQNCDKIRTYAFCFSCKTALAWPIELRFDLTYEHYQMNWCCK